MVRFINTVDVFGDEAVAGSIVDRSITEFKDNGITNVGNYAFYGCENLAYVDLPCATELSAGSFENCRSLKAFILRGSTLCAIKNSTLFYGSGIKNKTGYVYVPRDLVYSYESAFGWKNHVSQIRAIEDYTVDGTITGELDSTKI
jgi:hypothetical protein